jgi:RNA polymerase sigma factor (sigma-70 family)
MLTARRALAEEPLLTPDEETELAGQIEAGVLAADARAGGRCRCGASEAELLLLEELGERARQRYIRANLRLVAKIARQAAARTGLSESDLFQEGCLGLMAAVERFDHRRGYKFSTYASFWVRAHVGAAAANSLGALNVPASRASQLRAARGVEGALTQSHGRAASLAEVAIGLGRSEKWTAELLAHQLPQSFDALQTDVRDAAAGPSLEDEAALEPERPGAELLWHLHGLEREVLALRFGFADGTAHSYAEVGRLLTITVSKARRLEHRALEVLRSVCPSGAAAGR